ncbi:hypothetical protein LTR78_009931 [Recurvomyces mirabilis]|uniref:DUF7053 domain-containing protein n=1 Tax=Recurvomyces mirabilis TaxID=574656 RepID=A0AAE0TNP5_9PEZI|nr:hypothetical protein LTR78_009931 [Recurvomyces mirabilis]KAK5160363.1 hypothetical protein LTS14_001375 [Recurvomyces mirabilis]
MGKRIVYTKITPLPSNIPRQLALDMLHSHEEVIKLNPLVTGVTSIDAPRDARSDEFFSQWYEISEIITWGFGLKKKIAFKGVFHSQPWGLQSHVYAPMNTDMRNKYKIGGNQPGEPREARELGVNTPLDGLYLREDVDIMCSVPLTASFVKKEAQAATAIMVDRLSRKAELLDEGKLHAMFEAGVLKTSKPNADATFADRPLPSPNSASDMSPSIEPDSAVKRQSSFGGGSAALDDKGYGRYHEIARSGTQSSRSSTYVPQYQKSGYQGPEYTRTGAELAGVPEVAEMPGSFYQPDQQHSPGLYPPPLKSQGQVFRAELPGDYQMLAPPTKSANSSPQPSQGGFQQYHQPPSNQSSSPQPSYQAYQHSSAQPSPNMPNRASSTSSSTYSTQQYQMTNPSPQPPQQAYPAYRAHSNSEVRQETQQQPYQPYSQQQQQQQNQHQHQGYRSGSHSSAQTDQVAAWQRGLNNASTDDPNTMRNSVATSSFSSEPDHQRFSGLSIQNTPVQQQSQVTQGVPNLSSRGSTRVSKCPVCGLFEGDEAAISHHVSMAHFA